MPGPETRASGFRTRTSQAAHTRNAKKALLGYGPYPDRGRSSGYNDSQEQGPSFGRSSGSTDQHDRSPWSWQEPSGWTDDDSWGEWRG